MRTLAVIALALLTAVGASAQPAKPIVYVLSTGGTIAGSGSSSTDLSNYRPGAILGEQLVKAVPQIAQIADVRVEQVVNVNSSDITIENWLTLAKRIQAILQ
jgi:L-asparaginase